MASVKGKVLELPERSPSEEKDGAALLNDMVFFALPTPLFKALSDVAARRQQTLAQFLSEAVSEAINKPSGPSLLTEKE